MSDDMTKSEFESVMSELRKRSENEKCDTLSHLVVMFKDIPILKLTKCIPEYTGMTAKQYLIQENILKENKIAQKGINGLFQENGGTILQNAFCDIKLSDIQKKTFFILSSNTSVIKDATRILHKHGAVIKKKIGNEVEFFITSRTNIPRDAGNNGDLAKAIDIFIDRGKPVFVNVQTLIGLEQKYIDEKNANETFDDKVDRAQKMMKETISKVKLALDDTYVEVVVHGYSSFHCQKNKSIEEALKFNMAAGGPDISANLLDIQKGVDVLDGLTGLDRIVKLLVTCYIFVDSSTYAEVELARDKWEYRGEYNMGYRIAFTFPDIKIYKKRYKKSEMNEE